MAEIAPNRILVNVEIQHPPYENTDVEAFEAAAGAGFEVQNDLTYTLSLSADLTIALAILRAHLPGLSDGVVASFLCDGIKALRRRRERPSGDQFPPLLLGVTESPGVLNRPRYYAVLRSQDEQQVIAAIQAFAALPIPEGPRYEWDPSAEQWREQGRD
jgi:hypothetical protein